MILSKSTINTHIHTKVSFSFVHVTFSLIQSTYSDTLSVDCLVLMSFFCQIPFFVMICYLVYTPGYPA